MDLFDLPQYSLLLGKVRKKINVVIFHFVKSTLPFSGSVQWAGELYRVLYLI